MNEGEITTYNFGKVMGMVKSMGMNMSMGMDMGIGTDMGMGIGMEWIKKEGIFICPIILMSLPQNNQP